PLGAAGLGGDGPAGQAAGPVAAQDPFGGVEELLADIPDGYPCRHVAPWLASGRLPTRVGVCPLYPGPNLSRTSIARWRSRSAPTPSATTGPAPVIPDRWSTRSSLAARGARSLTSGVGRASPPASSRRAAAWCRGAIPIPGWPRWRVRPAST